jgi:hypothetical protein
MFISFARPKKRTKEKGSPALQGSKSSVDRNRQFSQILGIQRNALKKLLPENRKQPFNID